MIPKKIHYVWFSDEPYPPLIQKCLDSWKEKLPDYEIILWNRSNFDVHINSWCSQAFDAKKYAFVTDYARLYVLYHHGGIYMDVDVEVTRNYDSLLSDSAFTSFTAKPNMIQAETIGSEAGHEMIGKLLKYYETRNFINEDGKYNQKTIDEIFYEIFSSEGLINNRLNQYVSNVHIYPPGYFLMSDDLFYLSYGEGTKYLKETYSLHYAAGEWELVKNKFYLWMKKWYFDHFWFVVKVIRNPILFKLWQFVIRTFISREYHQAITTNSK